MTTALKDDPKGCPSLGRKSHPLYRFDSRFLAVDLFPGRVIPVN